MSGISVFRGIPKVHPESVCLHAGRPRAEFIVFINDRLVSWQLYYYVDVYILRNQKSVHFCITKVL